MTHIPWGALRSLTAREIISALIRDGFSLHNQRGSHQRYRHADGRRLTVTYRHLVMSFIIMLETSTLRA